MLQNVMILISFGLGVWLIAEMLQRFSWFSSLVRAILTYGSVAFVVCSAIGFVLIPFFSGMDILLLIFAYMFGTPVVVLTVAIIGWAIDTRKTDTVDYTQRYGTPDVSAGHMMMRNDKAIGDYYDAF